MTATKTATKAATKRNPVRGGITLSAFLYAISKRESGDYGAVNQDSGALGKYQVLPSNVAAWSKEALGYSITPQQFLTHPRMQERIVRYKLGHYFRAYGPAGAAAAWYSGDPNKAGDTTPQPGGYPSVAQYVQDVYDIARGAMHLKPRQLAVNPPARTGGQVENVVSASGILHGAEKALTDPFGWVAGKTVGPVIHSVEKLVTQSLIVLVGVGIIVVGAYEAFKREDTDGGGGGGGGGGLIAAPAKGGGGTATSAASGGIAGAAEMAAV